jgi:tRNA(fMet)-specific endonuclease VapC
VGALVDSSVLIATERGGLTLAVVLPRHAADDVAISAVSASELLHGIARARSAAHRLRRQQFVETLLGLLPVLPFDLLAARAHARIWAKLAQDGSMVGERDLMIAATALSRDLLLITRDRRSFPRIPNLRIELV